MSLDQLELFIGNKTYSSWSMRPWVLMRGLEINFKETMVAFDGFDETSIFKRKMASIHPMATVPVLKHNDLTIGDSLSIIEYLADIFPEKGVWPSDLSDRAHARELTAAMHAGYGAIRGLCPMNIGVTLGDIGKRLLDENPDLGLELQKLEKAFAPYLCEGSFLFGDFSAVDAFYAPVMMRIKTYQLPISDLMTSYQQKILTHPAVTEWVRDALAEQSFLDFEEPYRKSADEGRAWSD